MGLIRRWIFFLASSILRQLDTEAPNSKSPSIPVDGGLNYVCVLVLLLPLAFTQSGKLAAGEDGEEIEVVGVP